MKFTIYQESRVGKRTSNQDRMAHCYSRDALLMVIADGMGGHLHGEVAAQIAVQFITEAFQREAQPALLDPFLFLSKGLLNAHHAIADYAAERRLEEAPRTTCVVCVVQESVAYWAHAGDSRLYMVRAGRVTACTRDHSRVQLMLDQGLIDEKAAATHPARNRIYSCLGGNQPPQIEFSRKTPLLEGDVLALCTDGAWGPLSTDMIARTLNGANLMQAVPKLMSDAEILGGETCDNLSMIALRWEDNYGQGGPDSVMTQSLPIGGFTTEIRGFSEARVPEGVTDLTDEEIEQAIQEISTAIKKYSR